MSIRIVVKEVSFQELSEDADGDGWVTKLQKLMLSDLLMSASMRYKFVWID